MLRTKINTKDAMYFILSMFFHNQAIVTLLLLFILLFYFYFITNIHYDPLKSNHYW